MSINFSTGSNKIVSSRTLPRAFFKLPHMKKGLWKYMTQLWRQVPQKNLGVLIDSELTFHDHITRLFSKANQKFSALAWVSTYMTLQKRHLLMSSYIPSQFNYCPLFWMIHNRKLNKKKKQNPRKNIKNSTWFLGIFEKMINLSL